MCVITCAWCIIVCLVGAAQLECESCEEAGVSKSFCEQGVQPLIVSTRFQTHAPCAWQHLHFVAFDSACDDEDTAS